MGATTKTTNFTFKNAEFKMEEPVMDLESHNGENNFFCYDASEDNFAAE